MRKLFAIGFVTLFASSMSCCTPFEEVALEVVVCCGGACDAPEGYCCADGTCHGNHAELPKWERDS